MKKQLLILTALFFLATLTSYAQDGGDRVFKKFKVDVSLGYAVPQVSGSGGTNAGALFVIEPKYAVMDQLSVGLRMEGAAMANIDKEGETGTAKVNISYLATGDYYFSNNKFRPFAGAGAGIYTYANIDSETFDPDTDVIHGKSKFGFMARTGFEYGHLRIGVEYNFVAEKNGYLGLKIGAVIGGGRK